MNSDKIEYLKAMGIQTWHLKQQPGSVTLVGDDSGEWDSLRTAVASCTACGLEKTRTQTVFGVGNRNAELMIVGEAPGFNEDKQGEPFVGRAGQLLTAMLQAIGMERETVYIANILKCRPPNNRDPLPEEVNLCTGFLQKQIALIQPKLLLAVGRIAAQYLLESKATLGNLRGRMHKFGDTPLVITYHPAYLLRNPKDKAKAFQDLQLTYRSLQDSLAVPSFSL
jgi:uracil-DNA glycosylase family 4